MRLRRERWSPWGEYKHATILSALPVEEREEAVRLERRKRLSAASEERLAQLTHKAAQLHQARQEHGDAPPDTSWFTPMWSKLSDEEQARYDAYIAWRRLTHNGHRNRDQMSPEAQAEYDSYGFKAATPPPFTAEEHDEAKRAYEAVTRQLDNQAS